VSTELVVRPGKEVPTWGDFVALHEPYAIALDGYVTAPPDFTQTQQGPYANFDHHVGVNRLATLSTAQQVLRGIRLGLTSAYRRDNEYHASVYVNDCDQDISLAYFLLQHAPDVQNWRDKRLAAPLRNLVDMEGDLDVTGGAYPYGPRMKLMREIAWIFHPYTEFRRSGELYNMNATAYRHVIGRTCGRISLHLAGRGKERKLNTAFRVIGGGEGWSMFTELGAEGRIGAFRKGIEAFVISSERPDGTFQYSVGRLSEFVPFDVPRIIEHLNMVEGLGQREGWGGSDTIGGSPRLTGSRLDPDMLARLINDLVYPR
jgi:hypothetical protein